MMEAAEFKVVFRNSGRVNQVRSEMSYKKNSRVSGALELYCRSVTQDKEEDLGRAMIDAIKPDILLALEQGMPSLASVFGHFQDGGWSNLLGLGYSTEDVRNAHITCERFRALCKECGISWWTSDQLIFDRLEPEIRAALEAGADSLLSIYAALADGGWAILYEYGYSDEQVAEVDLTFDQFLSLCRQRNVTWWRGAQYRKLATVLQPQVATALEHGFSLREVYTELIESRWATLPDRHGFSEEQINELDLRYSTFRRLFEN